MNNFHPKFVDAYAFSKESRFKFKIHDILFSFTVFEKPPSYFKSRHLRLFLQEFLRVHKNMYPQNIITKTNVNIVIYDILLKKQLPAAEMAIKAEHINSGYCFVNSTMDSTNIVIYRREELYKVLIHELLHFFNTVPTNQDMQNRFSALFTSVSNTIHVNEAVVELHALCMNCRVIANLTNEPYMDLLYAEYDFSIKQIRKLLTQQNVKFDCIMKNKFEWNEKTHAFSYFVLKHIFFSHMLGLSLGSISNQFKYSKKKVQGNNYIKMTTNAYNFN